MKKQVININISADLTPEQETIEISKILRAKHLSGSAKNKHQNIRIGQGIDIKQLQTTIIVNRVAKFIEFVPCNVCGCEYQNDLFKKVFVNYGGKVKYIKVCSTSCQEQMIDMCGEGRAATSAKKLKPFRLN